MWMSEVHCRSFPTVLSTTPSAHHVDPAELQSGGPTSKSLTVEGDNCWLLHRETESALTEISYPADKQHLQMLQHNDSLVHCVEKTKAPKEKTDSHSISIQGTGANPSLACQDKKNNVTFSTNQAISYFYMQLSGERTYIKICSKF